MKKIILSLLTISTLTFADSMTLNCSFPSYTNGKIDIYPSKPGSPLLTFNYTGGPGQCWNNRDSITGDVGIDDASIILKDLYCSINIDRATGKINVTNQSMFNNEKKTYEGTCVKQLKKPNVI